MVLSALSQLDYFRKTRKDVQEVSSASGGLISLIGGLVVVVLVFSEVISLLYGQYKSYPFLRNSDVSEHMRIHVNITFEEIFCYALSVDYQDIIGTH